MWTVGRRAESCACASLFCRRRRRGRRRRSAAADGLDEDGRVLEGVEQHGDGPRHRDLARVMAPRRHGQPADRGSFVKETPTKRQIEEESPGALEELVRQPAHPGALGQQEGGRAAARRVVQEHLEPDGRNLGDGRAQVRGKGPRHRADLVGQWRHRDEEAGGREINIHPRTLHQPFFLSMCVIYCSRRLTDCTVKKN